MIIMKTVSKPVFIEVGNNNLLRQYEIGSPYKVPIES